MTDLTRIKILTYKDIRDCNYDNLPDPFNVLKSGIKLYKDALLSNPYCKKDINQPSIALILKNNLIVGRHIILNSNLKAGDKIINIKTGGGIFVYEKYQGLGLGSQLISNVQREISDFYYGALFSRKAYDIIRKTNIMHEIPQYVKYRYSGLKQILDIPIFIRKTILLNRYVLHQLYKVPEWAGSLIKQDNHKYMEEHSTEWLQWALDKCATGNPTDHQSFYAIYNKKGNPMGFFMLKIRQDLKRGFGLKANLLEWETVDQQQISELDINILAYYSLEKNVNRLWIISDNDHTRNQLKFYNFKRRGWLAISISDNKNQFEDISDLKLWRIRYGCCNTTLVE